MLLKEEEITSMKLAFYTNWTFRITPADRQKWLWTDCWQHSRQKPHNSALKTQKAHQLDLHLCIKTSTPLQHLQIKLENKWGVGVGGGAPAEAQTVLTHRPEINDLPWAERRSHTCLCLTQNLTWRAGSLNHALLWQRAHCTHASGNLTGWDWRPRPHHSYLQPYVRILIIDPSHHITKPFCMHSCTGDYPAHMAWIINPTNLRSALEISVTVIFWWQLQAAAVQ